MQQPQRAIEGAAPVLHDGLSSGRSRAVWWIVAEGSCAMRVDLDAKVVARDGEEIGSVDRAIVDPRTEAVTAIVVRTGAVFGRDIVVAREELEQAAEDGDSIRLSLTKDELEQLPDFAPEQFSPVPPTWVAPAGYGFPSSRYV